MVVGDWPALYAKHNITIGGPHAVNTDNPENIASGGSSAARQQSWSILVRLDSL